MSARDDVLTRVRDALGSSPPPGSVPRDYRRVDGRPPGDPELVELLVDRLLDYRASVRRCSEADLAHTVSTALLDRGVAGLVVPGGIPTQWIAGWLGSVAGAGGAGGAHVLGDSPPLSLAQLDDSDGVLTGCAVAIADTGTLVLDAGPDQGRRALTLVPDYHLCVVHTEQVVGLVPEALTRLEPTRPLTFISGPSATSDIELQRVEGVHGPRTLEVVLVT